MRVFVTGATGFIGSQIVPELVQAGHRVLGLTRSEEGANRLRAAGAEAHFGSLEDVGSLRSGAADVDGVIHAAFDHDFSRFAENCEKDRRAIEAMGEELAGSSRPLVITSGVGIGSSAPGELGREDVYNTEHPNPRIVSEQAGQAAAARGANVSVVRLPQVHDTRKQGLITLLIPLLRQKGIAAYVGDGRNRYAAAHLTDVARLYRLVLERNEAGSRWNAVAEEGIPMREIVEILGQGLKLPVQSITREQAPQYLGWMSVFADMDLAATSAYTQEKLGWKPTGPGLLEDLRNMDYAAL